MIQRLTLCSSRSYSLGIVVSYAVCSFSLLAKVGGTCKSTSVELLYVQCALKITHQLVANLC